MPWRGGGVLWLVSIELCVVALVVSSGGLSRSSTHRAPGQWLQPRPEQTGASAAPRHRRRLPLRPQIRALTKLALSCGFSRSSTHPAPWGVAPATPRTNLCVISSSCLQALASIDLWLWSVSSAEWWLEPLLDTPSPLGRGSRHAPNLPAKGYRGSASSHRTACALLSAGEQSANGR